MYFLKNIYLYELPQNRPLNKSSFRWNYPDSDLMRG